MGWNSSTKIMTAPLNINTGGDIQQAVNYNSGDLGDCIVNGEITKWAKWKPERNSKIGPLTFAERQANFFGFKLTKFTTISAIVAGYGDEWEYLRPRGLTTYNERFRFYDFLNTTVSNSGYNKNAECFFRRSVSTFPSSYILGQGGLRFIAQWHPESQLDSTKPGSVKRSEILTNPANALSPSLANCYFGIILYHSYWDAPKIKTTSSVIGSSSYTSEVDIVDSELQNFPSSVSVYPVFSTESYTSVSTTLPHDGVFALPMSPFTLEVMSPSTVVQLTADIQATYMRARVSLVGTIGMVTSGAITTVTGVSYNVYRASSLTDKTGAQIGVTQSYDTPLTSETTLDVAYTIITDNPGFLRIVITGYVSAETTVMKDFNIEISME